MSRTHTAPNAPEGRESPVLDSSVWHLLVNLMVRSACGSGKPKIAKVDVHMLHNSNPCCVYIWLRLLSLAVEAVFFAMVHYSCMLVSRDVYSKQGSMRS